MESLATLVPFEIELDWARVARAAARVVAILVVGALAYVALRVVRNRVGRMPIDSGPGTSDHLQTPTVPGVEAFGDSAVTIRMMAKTTPLKQWDVARELRRRIKRRFDAEGIEIPFPQRTVWHRRMEGDSAADPASLGAGQGS